MISCPAAKGIICSICRPSATDAPSGTNSAIASRMGGSLNMLFALPTRGAFLEEGVDSLLRVLRLHQLVEINLLCSGKAFVEVNRIPCVDCFFGNGQRGWTELDKVVNRVLQGTFQIDFRQHRVGQPDVRSFPAGDRATSKHKLGGVLLSNQRG